jgi:hypothetical protein
MSKKNTGLSRIFANHKGKVSDKWSIYLYEYSRLFETYRNRPVRLLEIGVQNGGSLEIWGQYFVNAKKLVGCDINPDCAQLKFNDPRIALVIANANTDEAQQVILGYSPMFDLIIDDGSHQSEDIVCSFARYFTYLNDGGLYIAEDLHCSYWQDFDGGLLHPYSSMAFFKRLADVINHEHWGVDKSGAELLQSFKNKYNAKLDEAVLSRIHSIEFINSMCVIKKASPANNVLGIRHVSGSIAVVNVAPLTLNGSVCPQSNQIENQFSVGNLAIEEELEIKTEECNTLNQYVNDLNEKISAVKQDASEREQLLLIELDQVRLKIENYSIELADRERAYSQQFGTMKEAYERQLAEYSQKHTEAQQRIESYLIDQVEKERVYSQQLQLMQQAHEQQIVEQTRAYNERDQLVNAEYKAREDELNNLIANYLEIEKKQLYLINNLQSRINAILISL